jgi:hypothetical protein
MAEGPDGLFGTADDVPIDGDFKTVTIPASVLTALGTLGLPITAGGVLELANRALAGQSTAGASKSDVSDAAAAVTEGFNECRTLVDCF